MVAKAEHMDPSDIDQLHSQILDKLQEGRVTPTYVANEVGESRQLINTRLRDLVMAGHVRKVDTGLYELVQDPRLKQDRTPFDETGGGDGDLRDLVTDGDIQQLRDELSGSGKQLEQRVDAILAMYDTLRTRGRADKETLLDAVDVAATGYAGEDSVWSNMIKGRDTLRALPGVETPPTGMSTWEYAEGSQ